MVERRSLARGLRLGAIVGVLFGAINIGISWLFPLSDDTVGALLRFYGPMFGVWALIAFDAARRDGRVSSGLVIGIVVAFATFFVFGLMNLLRVNLFLNESTARGDWQRMMALFRASDFGNLRAFVLVEYMKDLPLKLGVASAIGGVMGLLGGFIGRVAHRRVTT